LWLFVINLGGTRRRRQTYGKSVKAGQCFGLTAKKCRRSVVAISVILKRSAIATFAASTNPRILLLWPAPEELFVALCDASFAATPRANTGKRLPRLALARNVLGQCLTDDLSDALSFFGRECLELIQQGFVGEDGGSFHRGSFVYICLYATRRVKRQAPGEWHYAPGRVVNCQAGFRVVATR
jgi:hypothetical protein